MKHCLLSLKPFALVLNSLDTLSDIRIKAFTSLFIKTLSTPNPSLACLMLLLLLQIISNLNNFI